MEQLLPSPYPMGARRDAGLLERFSNPVTSSFETPRESAASQDQAFSISDYDSAEREEAPAHLIVSPAATTRRCRIDRITEQTGDRHRTDATRDGSNRSCCLHRFHEGDVAGELRTAGIIRDTIDADVDHDGAGFDPFATDHLAPA